MSENHNDLTDIISHALNEIKSELGDQFDLSKINLADLERRTGISVYDTLKIPEIAVGIP